MADFLTADDGLDAWVATGDQVLILTDDMRAARRLSMPDPGVHVIGTTGLIRAMERARIIHSADAILRDMVHPGKPVN